MRRCLLVWICLLLCASACRREAASIDPAERRIAADVAVLASDAMEGRQTGTRGFDRAADYVAGQMRAAGLQPGGDDGTWFQTVPLLCATRVQDDARLVVLHAGKRQALRYGEDYLPAIGFAAAQTQVQAAAVFVGQGVQAPEIGHDDFAGVDVRGKIAVLFSGAPAGLDNDRRAYYSASREKLRALAGKGAVGAVFVNTAIDEAALPWSRTVQHAQHAAMRLRDSSGRAIDAHQSLRVVATVNAAAADSLFVGSGKNVAGLVHAAGLGLLRPFDLPARLELAAGNRIERLQSRNVVGALRGTGSAVADERIVYTAHLDHLGIGPPVNGDRIYNGALDNALGVAILLEAARELAGAPLPPKRSLLFVALTGEEQGLLGAHWFARRPPGTGRLVANINMDMPVLLAPSIDVVPIGVEHSTLQDTLRIAAAEEGVALSADPHPEQVPFIRSDQYAFISAGIPAVYLDGGVIAAQRGRDPRQALQAFMRDHYHQPSDDVRLPIVYADAARLARLNARIGRLVGDAPDPPRWHAGDFFGEKFAQPAATSAGP